MPTTKHSLWEQSHVQRLLHTPLVLGNSRCCSHCACLGSLQTVDDAALTNIRQTWSEIFNVYDMLGRIVAHLSKNISTSRFSNSGTNLYNRSSHMCCVVTYIPTTPTVMVVLMSAFLQ